MSNETETQSPDATVMPNLTENHGSVSITIDKSVNKAIGRLMVVLFSCAVVVGASIVFSIWMIIAYRELEREVRLQRLETDEMNVRLQLHGVPKHKPGDSP